MDLLTKDNRLLLDRMIRDNGSEDNTARIRELKHSRRIEEDVRAYLALSQSHARTAQKTPAIFRTMAEKRCKFLFDNYTNIFNKLVRSELDIDILFKFIGILREIEEGAVDQNEASVKVGAVLKELYIDSALKREKKYEKAEADKKARKGKAGKSGKAKSKPAAKPMSWADYSAMMAKRG
jgi:hypothetical protein